MAGGPPALLDHLNMVHGHRRFVVVDEHPPVVNRADPFRLLKSENAPDFRLNEVANLWTRFAHGERLGRNGAAFEGDPLGGLAGPRCGKVNAVRRGSAPQFTSTCTTPGAARSAPAICGETW